MFQPTGGIPIYNLREYRTNISPLTHVAVWRKSLKYFHHYLILGYDRNCAYIIHYSNGKFAAKAMAVARITREEIDFSDKNCDLLDFKAGVYFIISPEYPSTEEEQTLAYCRALSRHGEHEYSLSMNNCECFVTWALTGTAYCEQFDKSGTGRRYLADTVDGAIDFGKKFLPGGGSDLTAPLYGTSVSHLVTESADLLIDICTKQAIAKSAAGTSSSVASTLAKTGATTAAKCGPSAVCAGVSVGITAAVSIPIEVLFCTREIYNLHKQKEKGQIDGNGFKRQVTKKVSGSASSVAMAAGTGFLGMFIGQIACPIPVVGGLIGGAVGGIVGSLAGRATGTAVSGKIYDTVTNKK